MPIPPTPVTPDDSTEDLPFDDELAQGVPAQEPTLTPDQVAAAGIVGQPGDSFSLKVTLGPDGSATIQPGSAQPDQGMRPGAGAGRVKGPSDFGNDFTASPQPGE